MFEHTYLGVREGMYQRAAKMQKRSLLQRNWRPFYILVNIAVDSVAILMAGVAAYAIRQILVTVPLMTISGATVIVLVSCVITIATALLYGLYRSAYRVPFSEQYREASHAYIYSAFAIVFGMYLALGRDFPPRFMALFLSLIPVFFVAGRTVINMANLSLLKKGYGRHNTMIVNWNGSMGSLPIRFTTFPELGYNVCAFACPSSHQMTCDLSSCPLQRDFAQSASLHRGHKQKILPCYSLDQIGAAIDEKGIERVLVPLVKPVVDGFSDLVRVCLDKKVKVKVISRESEELLRFSRVKDIAGISLYSPPKLMTALLKAQLKRLFDLFGSLFLILLFSPVFVLVAFAILVEDGRPLFFRQRRASMKGGRSFDFLKFRSMMKDAEAKQSGLNGSNQTEGGLFLLRQDPRLTRVGRWIRKSSIDELPQLFNVVKGEMSLVGPRPLSMSDLDNISPDNDFAGYYYLRDNTRAGMTGLWQICGRRNVPFSEMVLLDLYYIENQSIIFDLEILFATIPVVLFGRGAY